MSTRLQAMSFRAAVLGASLVAAVAPAAAAANFHVRFEDTEHYTDAALGAYQAAEPRVLRIIEQHLQGLADRCLAPGDALDIRVLDIDLAGRQEWWHRAGASSPRVMRDITWPRIDVVYFFRRGGAEAAGVRERISDMNYLLGSVHSRADSQPLPYERAMLTHWFERRFC